MTSKEDLKKLRELFYKEYLDEEFDEVGVFNNLEQDLEIARILKNMLEVVEYKDTYHNRYILKVRPNVICSEIIFKLLKEWLNEES